MHIVVDAHNTPTLIAIIGLLVSVLSLVVAFITLWLTHLRSGKIVMSFKKPTVRIHISDAPEEPPIPGAVLFNHLPFVFIEVAFTNIGARPIQVHQVRMRLMSKHVVNRAYALVDVLKPPFKPRKGEYLIDAIERADRVQWYTLTVLPSQTIELPLMFISDPDTHIPVGSHHFIIESKSGRGIRWKKAGSWEFEVTKQVYEWLENRSAIDLPLPFSGKHKDTNAPR